MDDSDTSGRSAGGLFDSLRALLATLVAMAHTRVELFGTEIEEEVRRVVALLLGGLAVLALISLALLFSGLVVIAIYWDTHRLAATVGVATAIDLEAGICRRVRVAIGGVRPVPFRATAVEAILQDQPAEPAFLAAAAAAVQDDLDDQVLSDIQASAQYREQMAVVFVKRALESAIQRARDSRP